MVGLYNVPWICVSVRADVIVVGRLFIASDGDNTELGCLFFFCFGFCINYSMGTRWRWVRHPQWQIRRFFRLLTSCVTLAVTLTYLGVIYGTSFLPRVQKEMIHICVVVWFDTLTSEEW